MTSFINSYQVLAPHECERIIDYFNHDDRRHQGEVIGGDSGEVLNDIKKSTDIYIHFGDMWCHESDNKYNDIILPAIRYAINQWIEEHRFITTMPSFTAYESYNIQHYKDGEGYFGLHCECQPDASSERFIYRMGAWMIYLNDAESGTEFPYQELVLEPKQGVCTVWPAYWTHPHKGVTPNRGDKYIATGWVSFLNPNHK